ncbi:hypothetical protein ACFC08_18035 [Streptomyces sp. NPDC056112]
MIGDIAIGLALGVAAAFLLLFGEPIAARISRANTANRGDES